jgi:hypothetical protein
MQLHTHNYKIEDFQVVMGGDAGDLEVKVMKLVSNGYSLGEFAITPRTSSGEIMYIQTMVKYKFIE